VTTIRIIMGETTAYATPSALRYVVRSRSSASRTRAKTTVETEPSRRDELLGDEDQPLTDVEQAQGSGAEGHGDDPALCPDPQGRHEVDRRDPDAEDRHLPQPGR
jgi:hypothetical protein